jgi:hypothetical protein
VRRSGLPACNVVADDEVILVELSDHAVETEFTACNPQALGRKMRLAGARRHKQKNVGARRRGPSLTALQTIGIISTSKVGRCLADRKTRLGEMSFDAATAALRHLMLARATRRFAAGQPSLSACSASFFYMSLTAGSRRSVTSNSSRAALSASQSPSRALPEGSVFVPVVRGKWVVSTHPEMGPVKQPAPPGAIKSQAGR